MPDPAGPGPVPPADSTPGPTVIGAAPAVSAPGPPAPRPEVPAFGGAAGLGDPGSPHEPDPPDEPGPPDEPAQPVEEHDRQGLELAKSLAARLKTAAGKTPVVPRRVRKRRFDAQVSGARPDDRDPQKLTNTLGRLLRDQGWEVDVAVHGVMARWPAIVGPEMAEHCQPESYTDTELTVRTDSTAWATQLKLLAPDLVRRLNAELGDGTVTRVVVQGPHTPTWRKGPRTLRNTRGPRDTYG